MPAPALRDAPRVAPAGVDAAAEQQTSCARISRLLLLLEQYLKLCENTMEREFVQSHQPHARAAASASSSTSSASWDMSSSAAAAASSAARSSDAQPFYVFLRYFPPHARTFYGVPFAVKLTLVYPAPNSFTYTKPDTLKSEVNLLVCKLPPPPKSIIQY